MHLPEFKILHLGLTVFCFLLNIGWPRMTDKSNCEARSCGQGKEGLTDWDI